MIKAEDLRIGNLVRVSETGCMIPKGEVCKVVAIDSEKSFEEMNLKGCATLKELEVNHSSISCGVWCQYISPIPLTPEILEENEFKVIDPEKCYTKPIVAQKTFFARYLSIENKPTGWKVFIKYENFSDNVLARPIKYIHEFQNLLWALGEDANLNIKTNTTMNKEMKIYKWKVAAFVAWVVVTLIVVSVALRGVSKADTATNLISVAILLFWTLLSLATNCLTFKNNKNNE